MKKIICTKICSWIAVAAMAQNPLYIPPTLSGNNFNLTVQTGTHEFFQGISTPTYGVNGNILAPTLILNKGEQVTLNVENTLNTFTTMHWHGLHVPAMADGGPHQVIDPGTTWSPMFEVMNDAATYWYHPHGEHRTDLQVSKGLAGLIIVRDTVEAALALPREYGVDDIPLILQTKAFDELQQVAIATPLDTVPMVNATRFAYHNAPEQVVRLRLLNGASDRTFLLGFSNNMDFHQIASDAGLLEAPLTQNRLRLAPGERAEILVDFAGMLGDSVELMSYGSELPNGIIGAETVGMMATIPDYDLNPLNGADFFLLKFYITAATATPITSIPTSLVPYTPWSTADVDANRTIVMQPEMGGAAAMVEGPFNFNGQAFNMEVINFTTYLDNIEIWTLDNQTAVAHPFHLHDVPFYLIEVDGGAVPAEMQGKKDVVLVRPMQTMKFITKFENFADDMMPYMYHCHLLHHEDDGMMGQFLVIDPNMAVESLENTAGIELFPNPASTYFSINNTNQVQLTELEISDNMGRLLLHQNINNPNQLIDIATLENGFYFVKIKDEKGAWHSHKLLIQRSF